MYTDKPMGGEPDSMNEVGMYDKRVARQAEMSAPLPLQETAPRNKQVPEQTISDECKYCAEGEPEWSPAAKCWIHRRASLDKRCTRKVLGPSGGEIAGPIDKVEAEIMTEFQ